MKEPRSLRRGSVLLPSSVAGILLALSLPPFGWWPLAFVGTALLARRLHGLRLRARLLAGWICGLVMFGIGLWWTFNFTGLGAIALIAIEALFVGLAAAFVPPAGLRWCRPLALAASFTLAEALRMNWPLGGLPIGGVWIGQANGPFLDLARIGGPLLLVFLVWFVGASLAELFARSRDERRRIAVVGFAVVVVLAFLAAFAPDGGPPVGTVHVAVVQGGGRRGVSARQVTPSIVFHAAVAESDHLIGHDHGTRHNPLLVVWPEDVVAVKTRVRRTSDGRAIAALARRLHATVIAGVTEDVSTTAFDNEAVVWGPNGHIRGSFEKVHRVPFGEYVPARGLFSHLATLSAVPRTAVPGRESGYLRTPAAPVGLMISFEVFYAERGRSSVLHGARLLVVPTNTSSYATSQVPTQEVAVDRLQAVAEGRDLVQAAPTGYSTIVNPDGDVLAITGLGEPGLLTRDVPLRDGRTLYEILGDVPFELACGLLVALGLLFGRPGRRPRRRSILPPTPALAGAAQLADQVPR